MLTPNASEAAELTGRDDPTDAARALASQTGAAVLITLGGAGALLLEPGGEPVRLPATQVDVVDTTGAGDTVNGALAAELAAGRPLRDAAASRCAPPRSPPPPQAPAAACRREKPQSRPRAPDAAPLDCALAAAPRPRSLAGAGLAAYAGWVEPRRLVVRELELALPHWPARLAGLRAGVMSDLHAGVPHAGLDAIGRAVDALNAREPDVHLLLGDYLDASQKWRRELAPEQVAEALARLRSPLGTVAVIGNHDWRNSGDRMWRALSAVGITVLEDRAVELHAPGGSFWVAGLADLRHRRPDIGAALREIPPGAPTLMLSHDPDLFPGVPNRVSLTLVGPHARRAGRDPVPAPPDAPVLLRRALRARAHRRARAPPARHERHRDVRAADPLPRPARGLPPDLA